MEKTKKIRICNLILLILLFPLLILAQQGPNFSLPSPQSQQLNKYIDFPVDHSTGVPQITIPLYVIKTKGVEIPISLNYHASGIKYGQDDGMLGLGWTLSCDYRVSRTIYGHPDAGNITMSPTLYESQMNDFETNLNGEPIGAGTIINNSNRHLLYPYRDWDRFLRRFVDVHDTENNMPLMGGLALDGEYDQFYYQIPNGGGKFIISDRSNQTITEFNPSMNRFTYNEGTASNLVASGIIGFGIKDAQQNLYSFGEKLDHSGNKVLETNHSPLDQRNITAWALTDIDTKFGEKIKFHYKNRIALGKAKKQLSINIVEPYSFNLWNHMQNDERSQTNYSVFTLSSIRTKDEKIDFIETPVSSEASKIQELVIRDSLSNEIIKKIEFFYHNKSVDLNNYSFLDSIKVYGADLIHYEKYSFNYYDEDAYAPGFFSNYIVPDQWGYNLVTGGGMDMLHNTFANDHVRPHGAVFSGIRTGLPNFGQIYGGYMINRKINLNPEIYSLRLMRLPTGGTTHFEYEPNKNGATFLGGMRIKQISYYDGSINQLPQPKLNLRKKYEYVGGFVSHELNENQFRNEYAMYFENLYGTRGVTYSSSPFGDFLGENWIVRYPKVTELSQSLSGNNGKIIYQYDTPAQFNHESFAQKIHDPNGLFPYHQTSPRYVSRNKHWQNSPMIGKYIYDSHNNLVKKEQYQYSNNRVQTFIGLKVRPNTQIMEVFNHDFPRYYISANSIYSHGLYAIETGMHNLFSKIEVDYLYGDSITTTTNYVQNFHGQVTNQSTINSKGQSVEVATSYTWDSPDYISNRMKTENDLDKVIQQTTKRNELVVDRVTNNYQELPNNIFVLNLVQKLNTNTLLDENASVFHNYDVRGNVQSLTQSNGTIINYLWSYDGKYPIAEIKGPSYTELESLLGGAGTINTFSNKLNPSKLEIDAFLAPIRNGLISGALANIELNSYTFNPSLGLVTSKIDGAGRAQYFEYDGFGRLKFVKGDNNAIEQVVEYNYRNDGGL